jgi:hypothetical protein
MAALRTRLLGSNVACGHDFARRPGARLALERRCNPRGTPAAAGIKRERGDRQEVTPLCLLDLEPAAD